VTASPERGRANRAVVSLIEKALRVRSVEIVSGERSTDKVVVVPLDAAEIRGRLES